MKQLEAIPLTATQNGYRLEVVKWLVRVGLTRKSIHLGTTKISNKSSCSHYSNANH